MNMTKFWRTLILLFAVTATISFSSCSDDDEPNSDPDPNGYSWQIPGDWYDSNRSYGMHFSTGGSGYDYTKRSNGQISIDEYFTWEIESVNILVVNFEGGNQERFVISSLSPQVSSSAATDSLPTTDRTPEETPEMMMMTITTPRPTSSPAQDGEAGSKTSIMNSNSTTTELSKSL